MKAARILLVWTLPFFPCAPSSHASQAEAAEGLCRIFRARDSSLHHIKWAFSVVAEWKGREESEVLYEAILWASGEKRRLELRDQGAGSLELSVWDGVSFSSRTSRLESSQPPLTQTGGSPGGRFQNGAFPTAYGLTFLGMPISQLFCEEGLELIEGGKTRVSGVDCTEYIIVGGEVPLGRISLDLNKTLLSWRTETLRLLDESEVSEPEGEFEFGGRMYCVGIRWTLAEASEIDGLWIPALGVQEFPGSPQVLQERNVTTIDLEGLLLLSLTPMGCTRSS